MNEEKLLIQSTLSKDAYWQVNKKIARQTSIEAAILLADLIGKENYFEKKEQLTSDGYFFNYQNNLEEDTSLTPHQQRKAIELLKEYEIISVMRKGVPPRNYYKIQYSQILKILTFKDQKIKDIINKNKENKSLSKDKDKGNKVSPTFKNSIYLDFWNSLKEKYPTTKIQQHLKPETKTYQKTIMLIRHLKNGTFGDHCHVNPEFLKRNYIRFSLLEKKWNEKEIKNTISRLPKLHLEGYWPEDKTRLPKDLCTLIYNPRTNTSWFLNVFSHPPRPINSEKSDEEIKNKHAYKHKGKMSQEEYAEMPAVKEMNEIFKD